MSRKKSRKLPRRGGSKQRSSLTLGLIVEDVSDFAVMRIVTLKLITPRIAGFKKFVGDGCGKLRRKCGAWASNLVQQGCCCVIVVHDLDEFDEGKLRSDLTEAVSGANPASFVVLIPKREIEAWLLYDANAIAEAFSEPNPPKIPSNPEALSDPKKHLGDLAWKHYRKDYINTIHNKRIAEHLRMQLLTAKSFAPHVEYCSNLAPSS